MYSNLLRTAISHKQFNTAEEVAAWVKKYVDLSRLLYNMRIRIITPELPGGDNLFDPSMLVIDLVFQVYDRNTAEPIDVIYHKNTKLPITIVELIRLIRAMIVAVVIHEADECIFIDGVRVFDPHDHGKAIKETHMVGELVMLDRI